MSLTILAALAALQAGDVAMAPDPVCPGRNAIRYYPEAAWRSGVEGLAVVRCAIDPKGRPNHCVVVSETPPSAGFGAAAVVIAHCLMHATPKDLGHPIQPDEVQEIPLTFKLPRD
jgi:TonB family protein